MTPAARKRLRELLADKFYDRAKRSARRAGCGAHAEDIAQEVLCRFVNGKGQHQHLTFAVIDVVRDMFGRPGTPQYETKQAVLNAEVLDDYCTGAIQDFSNEFNRLISLLDHNGTERAIVCLSYLWGMTEHEIGYCFGMSYSRISQIKKQAEARILECLSEEPRESIDKKTQRILEKIRKGTK